MMQPVSAVEATIFRAANALLSASWRGSSLLILTYHRVLPTTDDLHPGEPDAAGFAAQMGLLREMFRVLPLEEAVALRRAGKLPPRAACVTFDDGYANNFEVARPILRAHGLRATFFVAAGFLDGGMMWNDTIIEAIRSAPERLDLSALGLGTHILVDAESRRRAIAQILDALKYLVIEDRARMTEAVAAACGGAIPRALMMSSKQVQALAADGMEVGAHTMTHPILARLPTEAAAREITESKRRLQELTGRPVVSFAYPNGRPRVDYTSEHVKMVRNTGFSCAVSTAWGCVHADSNEFQFPRIAPWDRSTRRYLFRLARTYTQRRCDVV